MTPSTSLFLLRHGESTANAEGLFTGVLDVPLSPAGETEAQRAAALLRSFPIGRVLTSPLTRAAATAAHVARAAAVRDAEQDWRLLERSYGALTGRSKAEVLAEYGHDTFMRWRRSVDVAPPPMPGTLYEKIAAAAPFVNLPDEALRSTESLRDVIGRVRSFHIDTLLPTIQQATGDLVVVAHGNSLRALCTILDDLTDAEIETLNIPTGQPLRYEFQPGSLSPTRRGGTYLDPDNAIAAAAIVAAQGGT